MRLSRPFRLPAAAALAFLGTACAPDDPVSVPYEFSDVRASVIQAEAQEASTQTSDHVLLFADGIPDDFVDQVVAAGGTVEATYEEFSVAVVRGLADEAAQALAGPDDLVDRDQVVQWLPDFDADVIDQTASEGHVVGDPTTAFFFPCQWNMSQADCPAAWAAGEFGDPGVKVAVLDSGVDPFHQDLLGRIDVANSVSTLTAPSICDFFVPDMGTFFDFNFHGSFVSGIVAANGFGVTGVAPDATIVGVKVLNCLGSGSFAGIIAGIIYAAGVPGVEVINMSLGARFPKNLPGAGALVSALNAAVNYAGSQGVLVVSAAGNNSADLDHDRNFVNVPAQSGSGISAWAGDIDGGLASYSNHGRSGAWVGAGGGDFTPLSPSIPLPACVLPAFGHDGIVSVCSTFSLFFGCGPASYLFNGSGTSFSAPLVSGVAALVDGKYGGALNPGQIKTILSNTADDIGRKGVDALFSHGRVNAGNAVN